VTLEEDLIRRDLTINAMAEDEDGTIIDPFNGQHDLNNKLIRHVSDAFSEDPLRILRVARFAARYHYLNFSIAPETLELMTNMVANGEINTLTKERIWLEIDKSLDDGAIYIFSDVLNQIGALGELIPYFQYNWTSELSQQLAALMAKMAKIPESHKQIISFCLWLRHLPLEDCLTLADTLRVPNAYIDALILFNTFARDFAQATPNTPQVLALFNRADIWRRPERFELFINTFKLLGKQQSSLADLLTDAAKNALSVDVQSIIKQGYKGAEIKQQLDIARANAISGVF
jgi:tRNA nucleotidyltransferase (CCA-adding enzyme)